MNAVQPDPPKAFETSTGEVELQPRRRLWRKRKPSREPRQLWLSLVIGLLYVARAFENGLFTKPLPGFPSLPPWAELRSFAITTLVLGVSLAFDAWVIDRLKRVHLHTALKVTLVMLLLLATTILWIAAIAIANGLALEF